jgi:hypothetical protein
MISKKEIATTKLVCLNQGWFSTSLRNPWSLIYLLRLQRSYPFLVNLKYQDEARRLGIFGQRVPEWASGALPWPMPRFDRRNVPITRPSHVLDLGLAYFRSFNITCFRRYRSKAVGRKVGRNSSTYIHGSMPSALYH